MQTFIQLTDLLVFNQYFAPFIVVAFKWTLKLDHLSLLDVVFFSKLFLLF